MGYSWFRMWAVKATKWFPFPCGVRDVYNLRMIYRLRSLSSNITVGRGKWLDCMLRSSWLGGNDAHLPPALSASPTVAYNCPLPCTHCSFRVTLGCCWCFYEEKRLTTRYLVIKVYTDKSLPFFSKKNKTNCTVRLNNRERHKLTRISSSQEIMRLFQLQTGK